MRCTSLLCASVLVRSSWILSALGREQSVIEATSRGAHHRSEIGSYHLPISISIGPGWLLRVARAAVLRFQMRGIKRGVWGRAALGNPTETWSERSWRNLPAMVSNLLDAAKT